MIDLFDFFLHLDKYLESLVLTYGTLTYLILFLVIFFETGLVLTPFLPGDSLLFVSGALASQHSLNVYLLISILAIAAIIGDSVNYWVGNYFGRSVFENHKLFKKQHLERAEAFYEKHGGKAIIFARFIPIIRTFAPFVAGVAKMKYSKFLLYNIIGGITWVLLFVLAGFFFGSVPWVEKNMTYIIFAIIIISFLPPIIDYYLDRRK